jgi:8-oxo-dGTP pyrophosphatase MutT (NUDIX family)
LQTFIAPLTSQVAETYDWPAARFAVNTYLHHTPPPADFITSVRAVVLRANEVLVVQDPDGHHILPGGRREADESHAATAMREVLEETGWQVTVGPILGFKHFYYLTPQPPAIMAPYPAFAQLVYVARAVAYRPEAREQDGYELGAEFVPLAQITQGTITESEQLFLQAALAVVQ